jgi:site-specific DNA-methyltransferase (adenine-specific)
MIQTIDEYKIIENKEVVGEIALLQYSNQKLPHIEYKIKPEHQNKGIMKKHLPIYLDRIKGIETISIKQKGNVALNKVYIDYYGYNLQAEKTFENDLKRLISSIKNCKTINELEEWKKGNCNKVFTNKHNLTTQLKFLQDRGYLIYQMITRGRQLNSICRVKREHYQFIHPTQKPVELLQHLINLCSQPNELVFDGFSGSGSTAISCIKTNRRFIGCELDKEYFNLACNRIDTELKQGNLF